MRLPAIFFASTAVTAQFSSLDSTNKAAGGAEIEETEFEGDLEFDEATDLQFDLILAEMSVRGRGRGGSNTQQRINKQKKKKGKQLLRLLKYAEPERNSRDWLEYGCYCFLNIKEDILTPGIGKPIDPLDSACHALQECLKCINIDHEESKRCHPYNGYKFTSAPGDEYNDMVCRDAENSCQRSTCECDREFIKKVQLADFSASYSKRMAGFDRESECPMRYRQDEKGSGNTKLSMRRISNESGAEPDQCCGLQGKRRPFVSGPSKQCCSAKTYNPFMIECCADGSLSAFGQC